MTSKHVDYLIYLVVILLFTFIDKSSICSASEGEEASISRSLDLSILAWRPLVPNPYHNHHHHHHHHHHPQQHHHQQQQQQQFYYQNNAPSHLISYSHLDTSNKDEIVEAAKHNAQALKKYNELSQQPITSYSNPFSYFTQTPGPLAKVISTTSFINPNIVRQQHQQPLLAAAASNLIHARLPYPKTASLYSTKLNYLGKPEMSHSVALHQNSIHQTIATTPKIAGYTKEQNGRVNFHYHHPSLGMTPTIYDTTTKRIPMFGSSVTPHSTTKVHPVMSKLQAHMAFAAMSQQTQHNNKLKHVHRHNTGSSSSSSSSHEFSPPSQIVSNYANYESATRFPLWHHGYIKNNNNNNNQQQHHHSYHHGMSQNGEFHHHHHNNNNKPEMQGQKQVLPSVHPSIITPFLEQVHLKQKEVHSSVTAEQKHGFQQSHELNSNENNGSFEVINDVFSKHLVPPPPASSQSSKTHHKQKPSKQTHEKVEKQTKFNLSMQSPLQDASRFNYNNVISTATPSTTATTTTTTFSSYRNQNDYQNYRPVYSENVYEASEKPNVFVNLNRSKDNPYKQHKLLHPSYSRSEIKKKQTFNQDKVFLPTPYKPTSSDEKQEDIKIDYEPQHSYFTIEDAVTPHFHESLKYNYDSGSDELEIITLRPQIKPTRDYFPITPSTQYPSTTTTAPTSTQATTPISFNEPTVESPSSSSAKPRQKLRRKKPKPQIQQNLIKEQQEQISDEHANENVKSTRTRGNVRNTNSTATTQESELRTRNRLNHPNRVRTRPNLTSPPSTISTADYDYTIKSFDDEVRRSEIATTLTTTTTQGSTSPKSIETSEQQPDTGVRHRVRLRYKNKISSKVNSLEGLDYKSKLTDSQLSDTEIEHVVVKKPNEETTEFNIVTDNPFNEIKSSLKLPNLKLRNEAFTTIPTTAISSFSSSSLPTVTSHISSSTTTTTAAAAEHDENNLSQKIINRPRFSIKELKRKQYMSSTAASSQPSTTILTSSTSSTTHKPDSQRFNRFRLNLNRRRNDTANESSEEIEIPRKRYSSSTRFSSSTTTTTTSTESTPLSTKRTVLPKRTFPVRNFTKPSSPSRDDSETTITATTSQKPTHIKSSTTNRQNTRQRIQNYKKKDSNEVISPSLSEQEDTIKNINFNYETTILHTSTPASTTTTTTTAHTSTELPMTRETSIMKIAKTSPSNIIKATTSESNLIIEDTLPSSTLAEQNESTDLLESPSDHIQRVAELTISGNENSTFKSANIGLLSRRIPNYFTISTDDPILPIQAFFPQIKTNENN